MMCGMIAIYKMMINKIQHRFKRFHLQKYIIEICCSYVKEMIRLEGDDSRHSNDMNGHIKTSG